MAQQAAFAGDVVGFIGFAAAVVILLGFVPEKPMDGWFSPTAKWIFVASWLVYAYVTLASIAEDLSIAGITDYYEGYVEILYPVLMLMGVYAAFAAQQIGDISRSQRALRGSHDLMLSIVDSAPAGILFLDRTGAIAFANEMAKEALELAEDEGGYFHSEWLTPESASVTFGALMSEVQHRGRRVDIAWPSGRVKTLSVNTEPLVLADGSFGGVVATFERPA